MASTHTGFFLHQQQAISNSFKDFPHLLPTIGLNQEISKSCILSRVPYEHDDLFNSMSKLSGCSKYVRTAIIKRMPLLGDLQDKQADYLLFSFGIDEQWRRHKELLQYLISGEHELEMDYLDPSTFPDLVGVHKSPAEMHPMYLGRSDIEVNNLLGEETSLLHSSGNFYNVEANADLANDLPSSTVLVDADGRLSFFGNNMTDMKDLVGLVPALEELKNTKDLALRKQMLVPYFRWYDALNVHDHTYLSSLKLKSLTVAPLKSPEKVKVKRPSKKKRKRAIRDSAVYKSNSLQACEMLLSIIMDKKQNGKSLTNSLKKAGPELSLLLTQFSASITGTGLAAMFSVIFKVACGSMPFCTPNVLTYGVCIALFWLSRAVNSLSDTIICVTKNSKKLEFEEMMVKVDKSVNDIFFRTATLMAVLILRFA